MAAKGKIIRPPRLQENQIIIEIIMRKSLYNSLEIRANKYDSNPMEYIDSAIQLLDDAIEQIEKGNPFGIVDIEKNTITLPGIKLIQNVYEKNQHTEDS